MKKKKLIKQFNQIIETVHTFTPFGLENVMYKIVHDKEYLWSHRGYPEGKGIWHLIQLNDDRK